MIFELFQSKNEIINSKRKKKLTMKVAGNLHTRKRRKYMLQSVKQFNLPNFTKKLINDGPRRGSGAVRCLRLKIQPVTKNRDLVDAFSF